MKQNFFLLCVTIICLAFVRADAQTQQLKDYSLTWNSQSKNSGGSMPCGCGDIGLNIWVENGELYFYISKSGTFDENNTFLKLGRIGVKLSPNPFNGAKFSQRLNLPDGSVIINGANNNLHSAIKVWVDVYRSVIHVEIVSNQPVKTEADYESWRYRDRETNGTENNQSSMKWSKDGEVRTLKDHIDFKNNTVLFSHQNKDTTVFDATVREQGLEAVKAEMFNPLRHLIFGGVLKGNGMQPAGTYKGR